MTLGVGRHPSIPAALLAAALLLGGCGANAPRSPSAATARERAEPTATSDVKDLWSAFAKAANLPAVALRAPRLKPVAGFQKADVRALADRAIDVIRRSADPKLSRMGPTDALNDVYRDQYAATTYDFKTNATGFTGGYDWQWLAASRYPATPSAPKVVKVTGAVSSGKDRLDNGQPARYLAVVLQAHIVQTVPTKKYGVVPIVVRRTVRVSAFRPRGGPNWWPSVTSRTTPYGNNACGLFKGAELVPYDDADGLRKDLADLKNSLDSDTVVQENFGADSDPKKVRAFVAKTCATESKSTG